MHGSVARVRIVDDDPAVRTVFCKIIASAGFAVTSYDSAEQFIGNDVISEPGCILVDLMLPGLSGVELANRIQSQENPLPVIIATGCGTVSSAVACFKQGVFDFLEKPIGSDLLVGTVTRAVAMSIEQGRSVKEVADLKRRFASLSNREKQVLAFMSQGLPSKQIATLLSLSVRTVEKHRTSVMKKMEADSLASLLRALIRAGL